MICPLPLLLSSPWPATAVFSDPPLYRGSPLSQPPDVRICLLEVQVVYTYYKNAILDAEKLKVAFLGAEKLKGAVLGAEKAPAGTGAHTPYF